MQEFTVGEEPDAVPRARRYLRAALATVDGALSAHVQADAELVVSELVTNARLHAGGTVTIRAGLVDGRLRLEVHDTARALPVRPTASADAMTGRGLALVDAVCDAWGVQPTPDGKTVWAEFGTPDDGREPDVDVDALLAAWSDDEEVVPEAHYTVHLGDVPTQLLLEAKSHVDNLVREFTLVAAGARSGAGDVPRPLAQLIESVVGNFAEARHAIKRQAVAAAERGDVRTSLTLTLSPRAIEAGEAYLRALDEADAYARAARLLTLETPPQHRVFREWYVSALIEQLRQTTVGEQPRQPPTFEQRLLDELASVAAARRVAERSARLQTVTSALAAVATADEVAHVVLTEGLDTLVAAGGAVLVADDDAPETVRVAGSAGYPDDLLAGVLRGWPHETLPSHVAFRTGRAVYVESVHERMKRFAALATLEPETLALCALPLRARGRTLGVLRFSFHAWRLFDDDERRFLEALAAQTAQALDRSMLYEQQTQARVAAEEWSRRLAQVQQATAALSGAVSVQEIGDIFVTHTADALGAPYASLWRVTDDALTCTHTRGDSGARTWDSVPLSVDLPVTVAVRERRVITVATDEIARRYPALGDGPVRAHETAVVVPLVAQEHALGALALTFPGTSSVDAQALDVVQTIADVCAQAIVRVDAQREADDASDRLTFLAEASAVLSSSLDYRDTLATVARLLVPRLADWCSILVSEDGALTTVAVEHVDPQKVAAALEFQERHPPDPDAPTGAPAVVRSGESELTPVVTQEMIDAAPLDEETRAFVDWVGFSSVLVVPLTGRSGTFGAITLVHAESGRHYDPADLSFMEDLARRCAVAVENAKLFSTQSGQLDRLQRVAELTQHAILPPVPPRVGPLRVASRYQSATREALIGGDLYEVVEDDGLVRLVVADIRGKGLEAVRLATVVLGEFRAATEGCPDIAAVARQMDRRLRRAFGDEDFATALLAQVHPDGRCEVASCGHPPALLARDGRIRDLDVAETLPLGLGSDPVPTEVQLVPGDRLLLYTDGLIEARTATGGFVDVPSVVAPIVTGDVEQALDDVLEKLRAAAGRLIADDLAVLLAEFAPQG